MTECPECKSTILYRDGFYRGRQRWLCRTCGHRFSEPHIQINVTVQTAKGSKPRDNLSHDLIAGLDFAIEKPVDNSSFFDGKDVASHGRTIVGQFLNSLCDCNSPYRVGASPRSAKKILENQTEMSGLAGATKQTFDVKGKLVEYSFYMQKQGYSEATIRLNRTALKILFERGADLLDPESVKEVMAKQKSWSDNRKRNVISAYTLFLKLNRLTWEKPKCEVTRKIPFIPTEQEIDSLISGSGKKTATFLELMKQTAMRCGEAKRLLWTNIDIEKNIIILNDPEKRSNPRMWKVNQKLMDMLAAMPKDSQKVFGESSIYSMKSTFTKARKRLASKLQNPRLLNISFHTLRHWKATMEYHRTKDPYYVKKFLGHKSIQNTELYINIEQTLFETGNDNFTVKVAETKEEVKALLEVGFEYVCQKDNLIFLRKPK